jgi:hypothetical protein
MIKQKKTHDYFDAVDEKLREKLLPDEDMKFYAGYEVKRSQALPA